MAAGKNDHWENGESGTGTGEEPLSARDGPGAVEIRRGSSSHGIPVSTDSVNQHDDDPATVAKAQKIRDACGRGDLFELQRLAESKGGFLTDSLRQIAWPILLGIPVDADGRIDATAVAATAGIAAEDAAPNAWEKLPPHRDEDQVKLDVNRAFVHYPTHSSAAEELRQKQALSDLIVEVLRRYPYLCYFQGFHDICQVFLLVLPPPLRAVAVARLATLRIRDFMLPTIDAAVQQLQLLPDILHLADPPLWQHLRFAQHPQPFFALSGTLTMYAHDVESLGAITRLFDVLLARSPAFSLYLFAAIARAHRAALFETPADEPEMLHHILSKLPGLAGNNVSEDRSSTENEKQGDGASGPDDTAHAEPSLDDLIADAVQLAADYPPNTLPSWRRIAAASVLKTAPDDAEPLKFGYDGASTPPSAERPLPLAAGQSVADGERLFRAHVRAIEQAERRRQQRVRMYQLLVRNRGPVQAVGVAVLVGLMAVLLRRYGSSGHPVEALWAGPLARVSSFLSRLGL